MASLTSTGSPVLSKKPSAHFVVLDQNSDHRSKSSGLSATKSSIDNMVSTSPSAMDNILARLRANDNSSSGVRVVSTPSSGKLAAHQDEQLKQIKKQKSDLGQRTNLGDAVKEESQASSVSDVVTPTTGSNDVSTGPKKISNGSRIDAVEMIRVKQELAAAKSVINRQEKELAESRTIKHTMEQAMVPASEDVGNRRDLDDSAIVRHMQSTFNATARPFTARTNNSWPPHDESRSDIVDGLSATGVDRSRSAFTGASHVGYGNRFNPSVPQPGSFGEAGFNQPLSSSWTPSFGGQGIIGQPSMMSGQRIFSGSMGLDGRIGNDPAAFSPSNGFRRSTSNYSRPPAGFGNRNGGFGNITAQMANMNIMAPSMSPPPFASSMGGYHPRSSGGDMSPTASDFSIPGFNLAGGAGWSPMTNTSGQTYVTPIEPMNYRRLLDKSITCDWKYIVDKIVCNNDQQASIFLQQKLKVGTAEQKFEIVEAIINQAYPLMINRFGNFLVQRCFEHGTPDQVIAIANAIHGNVLSLSMDPFGCHVIQKAFDSVPESQKADMVHELLRRIPDTVIHRYACHVWQKLFELRWSGEPPQIMEKVNEALRGMWHEVALGETGSLVVQNIFENCVEEEKRPAIEEVIANIDLIAHGQFGNWCIQHLCEHAAPADKRRVIDHILTNAYSYSIDQFASKVVEKCLKIGGTEFLDRYLGVITTAHPDRPRIPLIDIAGDQYGNYLVQWILMNSQYHQREQVAIHIRKHMVSLRGSKFGSRVAMLCCNPAQVTRPGPGVVVNPFGAPGQPRGWGRFR